MAMYFQRTCCFLFVALCVHLTVAKTSCEYNGTETVRLEINTGEKSLAYLDVAMDAIYKAKVNFPVYPKPEEEVQAPSSRPMDCADLMQAGHVTSGVHRVWPRSRVLDGKSLHVYCDMDTDGGGWTVIQRRGNFSRSKDFFFKDWFSYKEGFGDLEEEFWGGNDNIFALSNQRSSSIRFDLVDVAGERRFAHYDLFWLDDETYKYKLHIKDYSGDAGDAMTGHDSQRFSTKDQDNDSHEGSCAAMFKGGWWYSSCHSANLNGLNLRGKHESYADGIEWHSWKGHQESLGSTEMKLRPKNFKKMMAKESGDKRGEKMAKESGDKAEETTHSEGETPRV